MQDGATGNGEAVPGTALMAVRRLYAAWNKGDFAGAAQVLDPCTRWDNFQGGKTAPQGPDGLQQTMVGGSDSGATYVFSGVSIDLFVEAGTHVIALCRRSSSPEPRVEVWTVSAGRVVRFRGFPLDDGMAALSNTTGSRRLEFLCRGLTAFNRRELDGFVALFHGDGQIVGADRRSWTGPAGLRDWVADVDARMPRARLDDVIVRAESLHCVVISAELQSGVAAEPMEAVVAFDGELVRWIAGYATAEQALAVAREL